MKRSLFELIAVGLLASSCTGNPEARNEVTKDQATPAVGKSVTDQTGHESPQPGNYVGMFKAAKINDSKNGMTTNKINLIIDSVDGSSIWGHSVVAGNKRPWKGSIREGKDGDSYHIEGKEPGDDRYDGTFIFDHYPKTGEIVGKWIANDKRLAVSERSYRLAKVHFSYNKNLELDKDLYDQVYGSDDGESFEVISEDAGKFNASNTKLKASDIENMYKRDLEVMRNAIYARHGYSFKNRQMRHFFDHVDWYIPVSVDITKDLTALEKENITLLKRYEQHAASYYDVFGR